MFAGSLIKGQSIEDSGLLAKDLQVLTLHRGASVFPNPADGKVLEEGDRLLCFGKLENMRALIPARSSRPKRVRKLPKDALPEPTAAGGTVDPAGDDAVDSGSRD